MYRSYLNRGMTYFENSLQDNFIDTLLLVINLSQSLFVLQVLDRIYKHAHDSEKYLARRS